MMFLLSSRWCNTRVDFVSHVPKTAMGLEVHVVTKEETVINNADTEDNYNGKVETANSFHVSSALLTHNKHHYVPRSRSLLSSFSSLNDSFSL